ncbi:MAG TPA: hypothetical protein VF092_14045 [Longimicrobium sp.]
MTDTAAPSIPLYRRRSTLEMLALDPEREIGAGGEAVVYHVPGDAGLVAKIYHDPTIERARKLALMLARPPAMPEGTSIAWPLDVLLHERGFAGFVMPFAEGPRVFEFYNPVTRRAHAPGFHFGLLHRAGRNLAAAFDALHAAGYVVGDVNESNLLVAPADARVTLVDADSLQVRDTGGGIYRSKVGKAEFTPPELQGVSFGTVDRAPEHDRFGLAVLLFLLLMEGTHPFAVRLGEADAAPVEERIRRGLFPHASGEDEVHPPRLSPPFDALDAEVREMFVRAFVAGYADPAARPTAAEWRDALEAAEGRLLECGANPLHRFAPHLGACPWCERARLLGGRDPFPVGAPVSVPAPRPRRPRRGVPAAAPFAAAGAAPAAPKVSPYGVHKPLKWMVAQQGPGPLRSPLTYVLPALVLMFMGAGFLQLLGILGLIMCTGVVLTRKAGPVRFSAIVAGAVLALFAFIAVAGSSGADESDDPIYDSRFDPAQAAPDAGENAGAGDAAPADPPPAPNDPPVTTGIADFLLDDAISYPVSGAAGAAVPPEPNDFMTDVVPLDDYALELPSVQKRPVLTNRPLVAEALAALAYAEHAADGAGAAQPDTVAFWLRIDEHGHVTTSQVIWSTHRAARQAASAAVAYLRYTPAEQNGRPVSVWVAQRLVIIP